MDPAEEFFSPYLYVGNNPIFFLDPNGANKDGSIKPALPDPVDRLNAQIDRTIEALDYFAKYVKTVWTGPSMQTAEASAVVAEAVAEHGSPDMVSIFVFAESAYGVGSYHDLAWNWITNGPKANGLFDPYATYTGGVTVGGGVPGGVGIGVRLGWTSLEKPTMDTYFGHGRVMSAGTSLAHYPITVSGDYGIAYRSDGITWLTTSASIGVGIPGPGLYVAHTYTEPLYNPEN